MDLRGRAIRQIAAWVLIGTDDDCLSAHAHALLHCKFMSLPIIATGRARAKHAAPVSAA
jgi:hypothetical protein